MDSIVRSYLDSFCGKFNIDKNLSESKRFEYFSIFSILSDEINSNFSLLNNGITVIAESNSGRGNTLVLENYQVIAESNSGRGNTLVLENYQIVNGCQTSNVLYECRNIEGIDNVLIPLKVIITKDENLRDEIIITTNSQSSFTEEQLFAITQFQKELEDYYISQKDIDGIYYERRTNQYQNINKSKIVDIKEQLKSFMAMFFDVPHLVSGNIGKVIKQYKDKFFQKDHSPIPYYISGLLSKKWDELIQSESNYKEFNKFRIRKKIMGLDNQQKDYIKEVIINCLRTKFQNYKPESNNMPFHYRLLGKDRMALYSFIQSLNTTFGTSIFEPVAVALAKNNFKKVEKQYVIGNQISSECQNVIQYLMNNLTLGKTPNKKQEIELIRAAASKGNINRMKTVKVDLYLETHDGEMFFFDLKTAKPNISNFKDFKRTLLEWVGIVLTNNPEAKVNSLIAIPYNPYEPQPYERWTIKGMLDDKEELLVGKEFWDFLGGNDAYEDLLDCFEQAGIILRPEIDDYFLKFKNNK